MTKVEAIVRVLEEMDGHTARLSTIYALIGKYKPDAKASVNWQAGIRGVMYREIRNGRTFRKVDASTYSLI